MMKIEKCDERPILLTLAVSILGPYFEDLAAYYLSLYIRCHEMDLKRSADTEPLPFIVAFITRRSNVLLSIFSSIFHCYSKLPKQKQPDFFRNANLNDERLTYLEQTYFITDTSLLAQSCQIADAYLKSHNLPNICIFDELLLHGRALNNMIQKLESGMAAYMRANSVQLNWEEVDRFSQQLLKHIEIQVYAQNNGELLLLARYQQRLSSHRISSLAEIRDLSKRFAMLIEVADQNNVAYSWSLRVPYDCELTSQLQTCKPGTNGFFPRLSVIQHNEVVDYLRPYPDASKPNAVCSIRWRHSCLGIEEKDNTLLLVPFIIFEKFSFNRLVELHRRIVQDLSSLNLSFLYELDPFLKRNEKFYARWMAETNELVLNSLIFHRFLQDQGMRDVNLYKEDLALMARNFSTYYLRGEELCCQLERLWEWGRENCEKPYFETYMKLLLADADYIWTNGDLTCDQDLVDLYDPHEEKLLTAMEDTIISIANETELHAYNKYHSAVPLNDDTLSSWGKYYSIRDILNKAINSLGQAVSTAQRVSLLALLIHYTDLGIVGMNAAYETKGQQVYTVTRAGEQALAVEPMRYQTYMPVLLEMQKRCSLYMLDLHTEILGFFSKIPEVPTELAQRLYEFTKRTELRGGGLKSWNQALLRSLRTKLFRRGIELGLADANRVDVDKQMEYLEKYSVW